MYAGALAIPTARPIAGFEKIFAEPLTSITQPHCRNVPDLPAAD